jgi:hypothetical protein
MAVAIYRRSYVRTLGVDALFVYYRIFFDCDTGIKICVYIINPIILVVLKTEPVKVSGL